MINFAEYNSTKFLSLAFFCLISQSLFSVGFVPKTKVWVHDQEDKLLKFVEIGDLKPGNDCLSLNLEAAKIETTEILDIVAKKEAVTKLTLAVLNNNFDSEAKTFVNFIELEVSGEHQFFIPTIKDSELVESWKLAKELQPGNILVKIPGSNQLEDFVAILVKTEKLEEQELICLSLKENNNFFVSEFGIIAHNLGPMIGITYVIGSGAVEFTASNLIGALIFLACVTSAAKNTYFNDSMNEAEKRKNGSSFQQNSQNNNSTETTTGDGGNGGGGNNFWENFKNAGVGAAGFGTSFYYTIRGWKELKKDN